MDHYNSKELLAIEIANALKDTDSYSQFLSFTDRYDHDVLRRLLSKSLSIPGIRNRAAYFMTLVKNYAKTNALHNRY
jgi:hypothetical protein